MLSIFSHICWKFVLLPLKSVSSIAHLLIEVFFCLFFWVLYIFWVVRWIASKIFSHSVGCWLSVLLYRSFLILPHLSICVLIFQAIGFLFQKSLPISVSWSFSCVYYFQSFMSFFFFLAVLGFEVRTLHLYSLSHTFSTLYSGYFGGRVLLFCPGWPDLRSSYFMFSKLGGIRSMNYHP
jgi:hypothetical protein